MRKVKSESVEADLQEFFCVISIEERLHCIQHNIDRITLSVVEKNLDQQVAIDIVNKHYYNKFDDRCEIPVALEKVDAHYEQIEIIAEIDEEMCYIDTSSSNPIPMVAAQIGEVGYYSEDNDDLSMDTQNKTYGSGQF